MKISLIIKSVFSILYHRFIVPLTGKKLIILDNHKDYDSYLLKQTEKTLDPVKIKSWQGKEWDIKLDGFRKIFLRHKHFVKPAKKCLCLGSRTGQEVVALKELGKECVGVDLIGFPPHTIVGDIHYLNYENNSFDLVFTNIFDHSIYPQKFVKEMERVCAIDGYIIINLQLYTPGDQYSENIIYDVNSLINMFKNSEIVLSHRIKNTFDLMNWEIVVKKRSSSII